MPQPLHDEECHRHADATRGPGSAQPSSPSPLTHAGSPAAGLRRARQGDPRAPFPGDFPRRAAERAAMPAAPGRRPRPGCSSASCRTARRLPHAEAAQKPRPPPSTASAGSREPISLISCKPGSRGCRPELYFRAGKRGSAAPAASRSGSGRWGAEREVPPPPPSPSCSTAAPYKETSSLPSEKVP